MLSYVEIPKGASKMPDSINLNFFGKVVSLKTTG
jgi:hypothetical protein